jgi:transposase InsO family protein
VKFAVIDQHRAEYPLALMCRVAGVSESGYHAWRSRPEPARARENRRLTVLVRAAFKRRRGRYGSPRLTHELRTQGEDVGRRRTARIMRDEGLVARPRRRRVRTTDSRTTRRIAPNLVAREFRVLRPNRVWAADITYVPTFAGPIYLAVVIDLHARRVVGWAVAGHMRDELVLEALSVAVRTRQPPRGLIHHSDRGSQYASDAYLATLERHGMIASMSRKADCWDNAPVESFFATLKTELASAFVDLAHARAALAEYIAFYNHERFHSALGYATPAAHELNPKPAVRAA